MNLNNPEERFALIEREGGDAYNKAIAKHVAETTVETVGGHAIRPVSTRFGQLYQVGDSGTAFRTLAEAMAYALANPKTR